MAGDNSVRVMIQGQEYRIRSDDGGKLIREAAELVDSMMDRLRGRSGAPVDSLDVAVLTALNLAKRIVSDGESWATVDSGRDEEVGKLRELIELVERELPEHTPPSH